MAPVLTSDGASRLQLSATVRTRLALGVIFAIALAVRVWGLDFGLPHLLARPDESRIVEEATRTLHGEWAPISYAYPPLFAKLSAMVRWAVLQVRGEPQDRAAAVRVEFLSSRALSVAAGVATVALLFFVARRLVGARAALGASFLLALTHLHVRDSHYGVTDPTLTLATLLAIVPTLSVAGGGGRRSALLAGGAAGLACAVKYPGAIILGAVAVAHFVACAPQRRWAALTRGLALSAFGFLVTFALLCPALWLEPGRLWSDATGEIVAKTQSRGLSMSELGFVRHLVFSLRFGLGLPLLLTALVGIPVLLAKKRRDGAVVLGFVVPYYFAIGAGNGMLERYALPLTPFLAIFAASSIDVLLGRLPTRTRCLAAVVLYALVVGISARRVVQSNCLLATEDTRVAAAHALNRLTEGGGRALVVGKYTRPAHALCSAATIEFHRRPFLEQLLDGAADPREALARYDFVVVTHYYQRAYDRFAPRRSVVERLRTSLECAVTISPLHPGLARADADPVVNGQVYMPFAHYAGFARPGPFVEILRVPDEGH